ncbi:hypothetical protein B0A52_02410 [Exophiala mesophila]|uniref:Amidohydrolase-related domain-containing protein n=1 Tax=Exophiala mesophila TaxID=212818 RepID=A0A438NCL1_EXOME|nr:hypothetical protein B0A52_02410 [Exophiala mesophila]
MTLKYMIKNATVVSVDPDIGTVADCDVLIEGDSIVAVGPNLSQPDNCVLIDASNAIVSPGFVDTHRHTWQTQLRTVCSDHTLADYAIWMRNVYGASYTAHDAYLGNYCGALESIDNGITCLVDHSHIVNSPAHADSAVQGLKDARIRATWCYGVWRNPCWEGSCLDPEREAQVPDWRFADAKRIKDTFFKSNHHTDLLRFGFAPAELDFLTKEQATKEIMYGRSLGSAIITGHIGCGKYDDGAHTVRSLRDAGLLGADLLFSHATTLEDDELDALRDQSTGLSSTPGTELQMEMGHPIAFKARAAGCRASLGIDMACSNPVDMFQQMQLLLQSERRLESTTSRAKLSSLRQKCAEVLEMATIGGAEAVGLKDIIGSITPGKKADLIITRCDSPRLTPVIDPIAALVLYANSSDVDTVFINGVIVKQGGKLTQVDWPKVRSELRASLESILQRSKQAPLESIKKEMAIFMKQDLGKAQG